MQSDMDNAIMVQMPEHQAQQLVLLFHGVGSTPEGMVPIGRSLAEAFPQAAVVSVRSPEPSDFGQGFQWFSVAGITEDNRAERIAHAMPQFVQTVRAWQAHTGVADQGTLLVGFSQGAIMALESTQSGAPLAGRVVSLSGRFGQDPDVVPATTVLHFFHGKTDAVIHYGFTVRAAERLVRLGADVTADVLPHLGHEVNDAVVEKLLERLTTYVPQRYWRAAQDAAAEGEA